MKAFHFADRVNSVAIVAGHNPDIRWIAVRNTIVQDFFMVCCQTRKLDSGSQVGICTVVLRKSDQTLNLLHPAANLCELSILVGIVVCDQANSLFQFQHLI